LGLNSVVTEFALFFYYVHVPHAALLHKYLHTYTREERKDKTGMYYFDIVN